MNDTPSLVEGDRLYARPGNYLDEKRRLLAALGERPLPPPYGSFFATIENMSRRQLVRSH
jgi:hypothetical protein